jgi:hypothetical protein
MVVDSDATVLHRLQEGITPHRDCRCSFAPLDLGIALGSHTFTIYAVDQIGTVSDGALSSRQSSGRRRPRVHPTWHRHRPLRPGLRRRPQHRSRNRHCPWLRPSTSFS